MLLKKTLLILILLIGFNKSFAACDNVCQGPGNSCSPGTKNNSDCCKQTVGSGNNQVEANAAGCASFCATPASKSFPECANYLAAPVNKGLLLLIAAGFGIGVVAFYRVEMKRKQQLT